MSDFSDASIDENQITDRFLFTKIWTSPRVVFRLINDLQYEKYFYILLFLAGIVRAFDRASLKNMGDTFSLAGIIGLCVFAGGLFGWLSFYIYAALLSWTGKWLKGSANKDAILRMLAYAMIPAVLGLLFLIPQLLIYGVEVYKEDGDTFSAGLMQNIIFYVCMLFELILSVYSLVLCIIGLSEIQRLSIGKAFLNLLLPVFVIGLPILALVLFIQAFE